MKGKSSSLCLWVKHSVVQFMKNILSFKLYVTPLTLFSQPPQSASFTKNTRTQRMCSQRTHVCDPRITYMCTHTHSHTNNQCQSSKSDTIESSSVKQCGFSQQCPLAGNVFGKGLIIAPRRERLSSNQSGGSREQSSI